MSDTRIRELLADLADSVAAPDLAEDAWSAAHRPRGRIRAGAAAALVAAVAVTVAVIANVERNHPLRRDPVTGPHPRTAVNVQVAPEVTRESSLPHRDVGLPAVINLDRNAPTLAADPIVRASAAFGVSSSSASRSTQPTVVLIAPDGTQRTLDISQLHRAAAAGGGAEPPFVATSLSPDGRRLVFAVDGGVVSYSLTTGQWIHYTVVGYPTDEPAWNADGSIQVGSARIDPTTKKVTSSPAPTTRWPAGIRVEQPWGPARRVADRTAQEALLRSSPRPVDDPAPEAVVVSGPAPAVLLIPHVGTEERYIGCCAVAGWSGPNAVIYESRSGPESTGQVTRLLSWDITRRKVTLAATVTAGAHTLITGSYAQFPG